MISGSKNQRTPLWVDGRLPGYGIDSQPVTQSEDYTLHTVPQQGLLIFCTGK